MIDKERKLNSIKKSLPELAALASPCRLCVHKCNVEREKRKTGICRSGWKSAVYSYSPHYGEEPPISGERGSGTIFFTHCNMKCVYCQNYEFSQESDFREIGIRDLANIMLELEEHGCHNINLVSPTHYAYQIVLALQIALEKSLNIPIVYNTGGYDSLELIRLLDGIIDIYLPDMRYAANDMAEKFSSAPGYADNNRNIIKEMARQVGTLELNDEGVAEKGVITRLLILPNGVSGTLETLGFLKKELSGDIYLSVMSQYHPTYKAAHYPEIARHINEKEYREVVACVEKLGFSNGWIQGFRVDTERFLGTNIRPNV